MSHIDTSPIIRCAVWIPPTGAGLQIIEDLIRKVQKHSYAPSPRPHLTLLKGIERTRDSAELKLKKLAQNLRPFDMRLGAIDWRQEYFRALFVTVESNADLTDANRAAHTIFEMNPPEPFEPHISLVYGDFSDERRRQLVRESGKVPDVTFTADRVQLVTAARGIPLAEWRVLAEYSLGDAALLRQRA
jgi:2'-5' RNA ligase